MNTAAEIGKRILWALNQKNMLYSELAQHLDVSGNRVLDGMAGVTPFTTLQIARICEFLDIRTDALFLPTREEFIERQTNPLKNDVEELVTLLRDLGYTPLSMRPEDILYEGSYAYVIGDIGASVLKRFVDTFGPMITGESDD